MDINIFFFGLVIEKIEENVDVFKSKFKLGYSIFFSFSSFCSTLQFSGKWVWPLLFVYLLFLIILF